MAVDSSKKIKGELTVVTKARELKLHTIRVCTNEKNFPKRYRWCVTNDIVKEASDICRLIIAANAIKVENLSDKDRRRENLKKAYELTEVLLEDIDTAYAIFHIDSNRIEYWTGLIVNVLNLLKSWMRSDAERYLNIG